MLDVTVKTHISHNSNIKLAGFVEPFNLISVVRYCNTCLDIPLQSIMIIIFYLYWWPSLNFLGNKLSK